MKSGTRSRFLAGMQAALLLSLAACGAANNLTPEEGKLHMLSEAGRYELHRINAYGYDYDSDFLASAGFPVFAMELNADGTGLIEMDKRLPITWGDGKITVDESKKTYNYTYQYQYQKKEIVLWKSDHDSITFRETDDSNIRNASSGSGPAGIPEMVAKRRPYWCREWNSMMIESVWYGQLTYSNCSFFQKGMEGLSMDCMARIEMDEMGLGHLELWDSVSDGHQGIRISAKLLLTDENSLKIEGTGYSFDMSGNISGLAEPDSLGCEHLICIELHYDENWIYGTDRVYYDYTIYLRPWGMDWAEVEEKQPHLLPAYYRDWYLPAIGAGAGPTAVIGGTWIAADPDDPNLYDAEQVGTGPDPNASAVDGVYQPPLMGPYGLSKADAAGIVPPERLQECYANLNGLYTSYRDVYLAMGCVHGKPLLDDPGWRLEENAREFHIYRWSTESGETLTLEFMTTERDKKAGMELLWNRAELKPKQPG